MRKLVVLSAVVAMVGGVNAASAADLGDRGGSFKDAPYEAPLAPIWGGLYVGGHVGGLWNKSGDTSLWHRSKDGCHGYCYGDWSKWEEIKSAKFSEEDDDATLIAGVHLGYNWQSGARVFGVETDVSFGDGVDYLASLRARLGYAHDNLLLYVTAGAAFAGFDDASTDMSLGRFKKSFEFSGDNKVGFVVGGGAEYKLSSNLSVGVEGLYYAFGDSEESKIKDGWWCDQFKVTHEDDNDLFVVRARMSYHFQDEAYDAPLK